MEESILFLNQFNIKNNTMAKKATTKGKITAKKDAADQLEDFMVDGLKDLYWAEKALVKNLPIMGKNATSRKLTSAINDHLKETKNQVTRLEDAFKALGLKPEAVKCEAMNGLLKEAKEIMEETEPGAVRDAAIIAASQKVEHYEIASYGTMATYAKLLGEKEVLKLILETLKEEKTCDKDLTKLAKSEINIKAK
jgi:ferritin-like metal-binding protein YciE